MLRFALPLAPRLTPQGDLLTRTFFAHGTAEEVAQKWYNRLSAATQDIQAGVNRVTVAPGQAAADKRQKWIQSLQDPAIQDKWANNVRAVSLQQWKDAMNNYGVNRVAQGAQAKQAKLQRVLGPLLTYIDQGVQTVKQMPDTTVADREARMLAMSRWMRGFQRPSGS